MTELVLAPQRRATWLFSRRIDLLAFGGSALLSFVILGIGARAGVLHSQAPEWAWIVGVLLVDVAHVWATAFRVYFDRKELSRRPALYTLVPVLGLAGGIDLDAGAAIVAGSTQISRVDLRSRA